MLYDLDAWDGTIELASIRPQPLTSTDRRPWLRNKGKVGGIRWQCKYGECEADAIKRGYCNSHYNVWCKKMCPRRKRLRGCIVQKCPYQFYALSLCQKHYDELRGLRKRNGDYCALCPSESLRVIYAGGMCKRHHDEYVEDRSRQIRPQPLELDQLSVPETKAPEELMQMLRSVPPWGSDDKGHPLLYSIEAFDGEVLTGRRRIL